MANPPDGGSLLGGLIGELAEGLEAAGEARSEPPADASHLDGGDEIDDVLVGPPPSVLLDAPARLDEALSAAAFHQADEILRAAGLVLVRSWSVLGPDGTERGLDEAEPVTVGRSAQAGLDIVIANQSVSKIHCRVLLHRGVPVVEDLRSKNGTEIKRGRQRIAVPPGERVALEDGDRLTVAGGDTLIQIQGRGAGA